VGFLCGRIDDFVFGGTTPIVPPIMGILFHFGPEKANVIKGLAPYEKWGLHGSFNGRQRGFGLGDANKDFPS
jgi:hypothetical protein